MHAVARTDGERIDHVGPERDEPEPTEGDRDEPELGEPERDEPEGVVELAERRAEKQAEAGDYPPEFEAVWRLYPPRSGANPKTDAFKQWRARLRQFGAQEAEAMLAGVSALVELQRRKVPGWGQPHNEFTPRLSTFLSTSLRYREASAKLASLAAKRTAAAAGERSGNWL